MYVYVCVTPEDLGISQVKLCTKQKQLFVSLLCSTICFLKGKESSDHKETCV